MLLECEKKREVAAALAPPAPALAPSPADLAPLTPAPAAAALKTWCICEMPVEDFTREMDMVECQGANCKHLWFHFDCIGKPADWDATTIDYYCAYCSRRK